ncbi:MAG: ATP-binding protein, partial [Candidatus Margulisiibacteriota bacterium]
TDGVEECHNQNEAIFGSTRIKNQLKQLIEPTAEDCTAAIKNAINEFSQQVDPHDDITILSIQFSPTQKKLSNPLVISLKNDIKELLKLQYIIQQFSVQHDLEDKIEKTINLVLEELISNIIYHGYTNHESHTLFIKINLDETHIRIEIQDNASAFNPITDAPKIDTNIIDSDREVGGLGIHIIKNMVDELTYLRKDNKNHLTIVKERK